MRQCATARHNSGRRRIRNEKRARVLQRHFVQWRCVVARADPFLIVVFVIRCRGFRRCIAMRFGCVLDAHEIDTVSLTEGCFSKDALDSPQRRLLRGFALWRGMFA
jgi:hypothetical protein